MARAAGREGAAKGAGGSQGTLWAGVGWAQVLPDPDFSLPCHVPDPCILRAGPSCPSCTLVSRESDRNLRWP